ncbi:uncharacterized protein LOC144360114 [Saccoglossus kowalevskii]
MLTYYRKKKTMLIGPRRFIYIVIFYTLCYIKQPYTAADTPTPTPETEIEPEPTGEQVPFDGETEPEPSIEPTSVAETEAEYISTQSEPTPVEILIPSLSGMALFLGGAGLAIGVTQYRMRMRKLRPYRQSWARKNEVFVIDSCTGTSSDDRQKEFLTKEDRQAIADLQDMFNRPISLLKLISPTLIALAFAPMLLFMYPSLQGVFWPDMKKAPEINKAIASFLAPSGFVYAISFGFSLQGALQKQMTLQKSLLSESSVLGQIMVLVTQLSTATKKQKNEVFRVAKNEAVSIILRIQGLQYHEQNKLACPGQIWKIIDVLRSISDGAKDSTLDKAIVPKVIDQIMQLNTSRLEIITLTDDKMHPARWVFLEMLSFTAFFGVMLINAQSYRLELTFCIMTVFSISALCYIVADLDSPYAGFFRVNVTSLIDVVYKAEQMYMSLSAKYSTSNVMVKHPLIIEDC